jgi:hypothetical protein
MFSAPDPKNTDAGGDRAIHGPTPARRITTSSNAAAARCSTTIIAWYGT